MDWDKLRVFTVVAEHGSFTEAGAVLGLSQSAVSRQIGALESSLRVRLFHRHARGLSLTEQGETLLRAAREIAVKLNAAEMMLIESKGRASGTLTITTIVGFGVNWLMPRLRRFTDRYPEIEPTLLLDDRNLNMASGQADVAIRMAAPKGADLIYRKLAPIGFGLYAAPSYLKEFGIPKTATDLDRHRLLTFGSTSGLRIAETMENWPLAVGRTDGSLRKPALRTNSAIGLHRAVEAGIGIGPLPDIEVADNDLLVRVLPELEGPEMGAYFVYPPELKESRRVILFRDFLLAEIAERRPRERAP